MESSSPLLRLNWADLWKTLRGYLITVAGFAIVAFAQIITDLDFGTFNLFIAPLAGALIEIGRRLMRDYEKK